jgi:hypothetical protein
MLSVTAAGEVAVAAAAAFLSSGDDDQHRHWRGRRRQFRAKAREVFGELAARPWWDRRRMEEPSGSGGSGGPTLFSRPPPGDRCSCCSFKRRRQKGWRNFEGDWCGWSEPLNTMYEYERRQDQFSTGVFFTSLREPVILLIPSDELSQGKITRQSKNASVDNIV